MKADQLWATLSIVADLLREDGWRVDRVTLQIGGDGKPVAEIAAEFDPADMSTII